MAESSKGILQSDFASLKETLYTQQQLLQQLYSELDVERESSATAASEALSMILRLQGEKAAVKMEAEQYKRLAEEKMCYAEESLSMFEDLIFQKEMDIASLYYQVQAYRYRLIGMGCLDSGAAEINFSDNFLQINDILAGDINLQSIVRRNSAPPIPLKYSYHKMNNIEREMSSSPGIDMIEKIAEEQTSGALKFEENMDSEKKPANSVNEDTNSYLEQIRKLDERVKEIAGENYTNLRSESRSLSQFSQVASGILHDLATGTKGDQIEHPEYLVGNESATDSGCSSNVHDVFEVPQSHDNSKSCVQKKKEQNTAILQGNKRNDKPGLIEEKAIRSRLKDETNLVKKMLLSECHETYFCKPSEGISIECSMAIFPPANSVAESEVKNSQLRTSEIIEIERQTASLETIDSKDEELKLLNEIKEKLNSIESEIRSLKTKKSPKRDDSALLPFQEAMLHFWI